MFICLKSSNIEGNLGRSASYLISVDEKYCFDKFILLEVYRNYKIISSYGHLSGIKQHQFYTYITVF